MSVRQYGNRATLPKTQKTLVWQIGDDADNDAGNKVDPRFIDNGDGIITDRATGLQWPANITEIIPGAPGVTPDNRINSWDGAWTPGTPYLKGACVEDLIGGGFYGFDYSAGCRGHQVAVNIGKFSRLRLLFWVGYYAHKLLLLLFTASHRYKIFCINFIGRPDCFNHEIKLVRGGREPLVSVGRPIWSGRISEVQWIKERHS